MLFVKLAFTLATEEAERIGLDHVIILLEININFFETYQGEIVNIKRWPGLKEVLNIFQVARISGASDMSRESRVSEHFTVQHSAIKMLSSRLAIIRDYVLAVESGKEGIFKASKDLWHLGLIIWFDIFSVCFLFIPRILLNMKARVSFANSLWNSKKTKFWIAKLWRLTVEKSRHSVLGQLRLSAWYGCVFYPVYFLIGVQFVDLNISTFK